MCMGWATWAKYQKPSTSRLPRDHLKGGKKAGYLYHNLLPHFLFEQYSGKEEKRKNWESRKQ